MTKEVFELYKEIIIDGLAGAGIDPKESKIKHCKQLMSMILEMPVEVIDYLEDVYIISAYNVYLESYWESDLTRWNQAICNITNGIQEMKKSLESIKEKAGDYLDTLTDAEMRELYLELSEKGYLAIEEN